ncbi:ATP-binding protein [Marinomonas atlantica]|uniref:ATP-binding protein n=1 Tax=Marinomonas atlantica TaxID=1806668 RepID=UPI00083310C5|nr:ATP-binding protein [Marinomonas atlantica]
MDKQIQVEVQGDHLDKVSKANALNAISELVWNALDADANKVEVLVDADDMGLSAIHIKDDGHGIHYDKASTYFRGLGGSWKSTHGLSPEGRALHGKEGQGRFKSFSIGRVVEWNTRFNSKDDVFFEYKIQGVADNKKTFSLSPQAQSQVTTSGTKVSIYEPLKEFPSLTNGRLAEHLTSTFATYLSTYKNVMLYIDGERINPDSVISNTEVIELPKVFYEKKEFNYELQIIEWKISTKNQIQLCNKAGFPLLPLDKKVKGSRSVSFTAYLKSDHITELNRQGTLGLGELETSLKAPIEEAIKHIKDYLIRRKIEQSSDQLEKWKNENVYPYRNAVSGHVEVAEKQMFDFLALNINELVPEFDKSTLQLKKLQLSLLKQIVSTQPSDLHTILTEVLSLSEQKQKDFAELLKDASLSAIISTTKVITDRLKFLAGIEEIIFNPELKKALKERSQLHKIIEDNTWIFGEQFALSVSDQSLTQVLRKHLDNQGIEIVTDTPVKRLDDSVGIVDLMLTRNIARNHPTEREHLVVELKAPKVKIGQKEINQIESYAFAVADDERFNTINTNWHFWIISNELDSYAKHRLSSDKLDQGILHSANGITIWVKTWGQLINECKHRLEFIRQQLNINIDSSDGLEFLRKNYAELTESSDS